MTTSAIEIDVPNAGSVTVTEDTLSVDLSEGRTISVPLLWFPRLVQSTSTSVYPDTTGLPHQFASFFHHHTFVVFLILLLCSS